MSHYQHALVSQLRESLTQQQYSKVVVHNYCPNAEDFLSYLDERRLTLEAVTPETVSDYLGFAVQQFRSRHNRAPAPRWESIPQSGIHGLLRLTLKSGRLLR